MNAIAAEAGVAHLLVRDRGPSAAQYEAGRRDAFCSQLLTAER